MPAVDLDDPRTPEALARVARKLDVDAVVVIRHEWWLTHERYQMLRTAYLADRCAVLMVDRDGVVLWRDSASTRAAVRTGMAMPTPWSWGPTESIGDMTSLARLTGRHAYAELKARIMRLPPLPPGPAVRTKLPPPLLHDTNAP
jgi:hypothetical protein